MSSRQEKSPRLIEDHQIEILLFRENGMIPNNPALPAILYRGVFDRNESDVAALLEGLFSQTGWPPAWRNGVYQFHHYHSNAHEVLGFAKGSADLILGGEGGTVVRVEAGDIALLPAGTGHYRLSCTDDFLVVGAYPPGQSPNLCRQAPSEQERQKIKVVPLPETDPVQGATGPVHLYWRRR